MPSINDIVQVAEALEKSPVMVVADRCIVVRNRNVSCRKCVSACPKGAIDVSVREVKLDGGACVGCGACISSCPTEAFVALNLTDAGIREAAIRSADANDGCAIIACSRIASKRQVDSRRYAEVPCLSRFDEVLACELAARGVSSVMFVDGNCETCKNQVCLTAFETSLQSAESLLGAHGASLQFDWMTGFPESMKGEDVQIQHGASRRGFFSEAAGIARDTAKAAAKVTLENELGYKLDDRSISERLRVTANGTLPQLRMPRHESVLNALDAIGVPENGVLNTRLFGSVQINKGKCNACSMCAVFCPTGALASELPSKGADFLKNLEFSTSDCVQCGMCVDVCWKKALSLSENVDVAELFDFEPRTF